MRGGRRNRGLTARRRRRCQGAAVAAAVAVASVAAAAGVAAAEAAVAVAAAAVGMAKAVATKGDRAVKFSIGTEVSRMGVERATRCRSIGRRFLRMVVVVSRRRGEGCGIRPEGRCRVVPILVYMIGCAMRGLACPICFIGGGERGGTSRW